ncbi:MAG: PilZ domain-containing protein [Nitrospirota bacterium]
MVSSQAGVVKSRSSKRRAHPCAAVIANGAQTGEGQVLDVSGNGCLVESLVRVNVGDSLQLHLFLPEMDLSLRVSEGVVRWVRGFQFGVEFMTVNETHRARLHHCIRAWNEDPWKLAR